SYDYLGGAGSGVSQGDLPGLKNPFGNTQPVEILLDRLDRGTDEGRAMAEIIHDLAPKATLAFHTVFGQADFATAIMNLANAGCQIIVDDLSFPYEPMFQDGIIAQAVDSVVKRGVHYFTSAGNRGRSSYESEFRDAGQNFTLRIAPEFTNNPDGAGQVIAGEAQYRLHDFDPGEGVDLFQKISIPALKQFLINVQWDSPSASACKNCPGAQTDLDIFVALRDNDLNSIYPLYSGRAYNLGRDPIEVLGLKNELSTDTFQVYLMIGKWNTPQATPNPTRIKYLNLGNDVEIEHHTYSGTVLGHKNSEGAITIGAVRYDLGSVVGDTILVEDFSSAGGTPIIFDKKGQRITPVIRQKPDICAPQGVNTSFFGSIDYEGDNFPNFFGTSAAAPHAAAVAALLIQAKTAC
ncbi:MAG: S8 family serine peptidase, partial [Bacteroidia bacterium]|nr:S8 family serine peptidase [Bacteroidia bacterium]